MLQTQSHQCDVVVILTDVQAYCVTFLICLFRPVLIAAAIYRKTEEAKLYTEYFEINDNKLKMPKQKS